MLIGAAIAGFLLWLATQLEAASAAGYWAFVGLAAAAGVVLALSQLAGGWTKWGAPRVTGGAFLLGFLPALLVGGWVLLASQPEGAWMQATTASWADQLALGGVFEALTAVIPALAFALGLLFGYTFDTTGSRVVAADPAPANDSARRVDDDVPAEPRTHPEDEPRRADVRAADEPVTAERGAVREDDRIRHDDEDAEYHEPDRDFVSAIAGDRRDDRAAPETDRETARTDGDRMRRDEPERGESRRGWFGRR
jgi:hypothetical protein